MLKGFRVAVGIFWFLCFWAKLGRADFIACWDLAFIRMTR